MEFNIYTILAIVFVILLVIIFIVTYILNKNTAVPEGCENIKISNENCSACGNLDCSIKKGIDLKKIEEELKEEEK